MADKHAGSNSSFPYGGFLLIKGPDGQGFISHMLNSGLFWTAVLLTGLGVLANFGIIDRLFSIFS